MRIYIKMRAKQETLQFTNNKLILALNFNMQKFRVTRL